MIQLMIRRPPVDYVFDEEKYRCVLPAESGDKMRHLYSELSGWDSSSITKAWGDFWETTTAGVILSMEPSEREEDFLAYLYAEQELRGRNLLARDDGKQGWYYRLEGLSDIWEEYDWLVEKEGSTAPKGVDTPVHKTYPRP
jgi:hypothetical protein